MSRIYSVQRQCTIAYVVFYFLCYLNFIPLQVAQLILLTKGVHACIFIVGDFLWLLPILAYLLMLYEDGIIQWSSTGKYRCDLADDIPTTVLAHFTNREKEVVAVLITVFINARELQVLHAQLQYLIHCYYYVLLTLC